MKIGEKANSKAGVLSGGQKRKLSVAIALIGNSQLVCDNLPIYTYTLYWQISIFR